MKIFNFFFKLKMLELVKACLEGDFEKVKNLIEFKADISANDNQAVRVASRHGHLEIVKFLTGLGADITAKDNWALGAASVCGHFEIVKFLVENKADVKADDNFAVARAGGEDHLKIVKFLLDNGADFSSMRECHKIHFRTLKMWRRWRKKIFLRKLFETALPLYYSPGFPGALKGRFSLEEFVGGIKGK